MGNPGFDSWQGQVISCSKSMLGLALGPTQPPVQWVQGVLSTEVKWARCEPAQLHPSSAKVKNRWSYTSFPPIYIHGMHRNYCTFICSFTCLHSRDQNDPGIVYNILHAVLLSQFHLNCFALCCASISLSWK